jgi:uncharacterized protein involved in exopolysaccharide biosynthesis
VLALVLGVVAAVGAGMLAGLRTEKYESVAALAIDQPRAIAASGDAGVVNKLSALRLKYTGLLPTQAFAERLTTETGMSPDAIRHALFARTSGGSLILEVGSRTATAERSHALTQAAADELVSYVQAEQATAGIPEDQRFKMTVVTPASVARKVVPTLKQQVGAAGLAGLVVFAAVLVIAAIRDRD